jgi:transcriptional regulator with XRE-family HTH domain
MITDKIKLIMKNKGVTNIQLANHLNMSPQSLSNKFYRDSFSVQDLIEILDFLECKLVIVPKPNIEIVLSLDDVK